MRVALALMIAGQALATAQGCDGAAPPTLDDQLRLDQLQARGTHNSYPGYEDTPSVAEWRSRAAAARASGAHYLSTDAPTADDAGGDPFALGGPDVVRCNPVSGPPLCLAEDVEWPLGGAQ
jgi:hypothetical protein